MQLRRAALPSLIILSEQPAPAPFEVITGIDLNSLSLMFDEKSEWDPVFSTTNTVASFQLPFAFPIDITQIEVSSHYSPRLAFSLAALPHTSITAQVGASSARLRRDAGDFATLEVPLGPATTDVEARKILLSFANMCVPLIPHLCAITDSAFRRSPFHSVNNDIFSGFLAATTAKAWGSFNLHGSANSESFSRVVRSRASSDILLLALARTAIGDVALTNIGFAVSTSLLGLQGLNARPTTVTDLDVAGGTNSYLEINGPQARRLPLRAPLKLSRSQSSLICTIRAISPSVQVRRWRLAFVSAAKRLALRT